MNSPRNGSRTPDSGFTLIEMMIVVVIVAVLAAIALPGYSDHVRRSRIIEATSKLADHRVRMEQYFLDSRTYSGGGTTCGVPDPPYAPGKDAFEVRCTTASPTNYTVTATGRESMAGFVYTIDHANTRATTAAPTGWSTSTTCWTVRKGTSAHCS